MFHIKIDFNSQYIYEQLFKLKKKNLESIFFKKEEPATTDTHTLRINYIHHLIYG